MKADISKKMSQNLGKNKNQPTLCCNKVSVTGFIPIYRSNTQDTSKLIIDKVNKQILGTSTNISITLKTFLVEGWFYLVATMCDL